MKRAISAAARSTVVLASPEKLVSAGTAEALLAPCREMGIAVTLG